MGCNCLKGQKNELIVLDLTPNNNDDSYSRKITNSRKGRLVVSYKSSVNESYYENLLSTNYGGIETSRIIDNTNGSNTVMFLGVHLI